VLEHFQEAFSHEINVEDIESVLKIQKLYERQDYEEDVFAYMMQPILSNFDTALHYAEE